MSQDFRPFFCFKDSAWVPIAPYKQAKTVSRTFFVFAKIFDRKVRKSRVHVLSLAGTSRTSKFFFRYGRFHIFKLLLLIFFWQATEAWVLLHYIHSITVSSAAPQTTLWGGYGPRFEHGTGDLEAGTLTTRPPHLLIYKLMLLRL